MKEPNTPFADTINTMLCLRFRIVASCLQLDAMEDAGPAANLLRARRGDEPLPPTMPAPAGRERAPPAFDIIRGMVNVIMFHVIGIVYMVDTACASYFASLICSSLGWKDSPSLAISLRYLALKRIINLIVSVRVAVCRMMGFNPEPQELPAVPTMSPPGQARPPLASWLCREKAWIVNVIMYHMIGGAYVAKNASGVYVASLLGWEGSFVQAVLVRILVSIVIVESMDSVQAAVKFAVSALFDYFSLPPPLDA